VTDANLTLGYLNPQATLGGSVKLDVEAARRAIRDRIAGPMGLSLEEAAWGILRMINAHMTNGIRVVSVQQGHDPRDFALVAFGGNGAVHAGRQAEDLDIDTVLVPRMAGALSAYGGLFADPQVDHLMTWVARCDSADAGALERVFAELRGRGARVLGGDDVFHQSYLACHYEGQTSEIWVPCKDSEEGLGADDLAEVGEKFHRAHQRERSFAKPDEPVHIIGAKVTTRRPSEKPLWSSGDVPEGAAGAADPFDTREVYFDASSGWTTTPIYAGEILEAGARLPGPAIVEEPDTTIVVYPGWSCRLDPTHVYHLTRRGGAK
jgi:N-methylhydantoinase A